MIFSKAELLPAFCSPKSGSNSVLIFLYKEDWAYILANFSLTWCCLSEGSVCSLALGGKWIKTRNRQLLTDFSETLLMNNTYIMYQFFFETVSGTLDRPQSCSEAKGDVKLLQVLLFLSQVLRLQACTCTPSYVLGTKLTTL